MTDIKSALQKSMLTDKKQPQKDVPNTSNETAFSSEKPPTTSQMKEAEEKPVKRRRGRPSKVHNETKIHKILEKRGMTRKQLYELIEEKYPDEPISPDAVSRIVSGSRQYYSTRTLFRICGALGVSPNMVLNWEDEVDGV
jgi:DNA-binding Xre family transcriptional regulator